MIKTSKLALKFIFVIWAINLTGCASLFSEEPMMGEITDGVYTQPQNNFFCPLKSEFLGKKDTPLIIDSERIVKTEDIPLSQRKPSDWKRTRIVSIERFPSGSVKIKDSSGTTIEISSGGYIHSPESVLHSGMSSGFSWRFAAREIPRASGRMVMGLLLVPWYEEELNYMDQNLLNGYRLGQGPDAQLWAFTNLVINKTVHTVIVRREITSLISRDVHVRDLRAIRDDIESRPELQDMIFKQTTDWLEECQFNEVIK